VDTQPNKHKNDALIGFLTALGGAALIFFAVDWPNTNLKTFVDPRIAAMMGLIIGCTAVAFGVGMMILGLFRPKRAS